MVKYPRKSDFAYLKYWLIFLFLLSFLSINSQTLQNKKFQRIKYENNKLVVDLGVGLWAWPLPTDYDGDGDYDLLVSCTDKPYNGVYFFENTQGNVTFPVFKPGVRISKGYRNVQPSYVDKKTKLLIPAKEIIDLQNEKVIKIYEKENIHIEGRKIRANQWKYVDYDGDENIDLVVSVGDWSDYGWDNAFDKNGVWKQGPLHGYIYLLRNISSTKNSIYAKPKLIFAGDKPIDVYGMPSANFADFDNDGDLDIICGEFLDKFTYFENIGSRRNPKYASGKYLTYLDKPITMDLEMIVPVAIDWDKDGDIDLVVGQEDGRVALIENTGKLEKNIPRFKTPKFFKQEADNLKFGALVSPFSVDWDNDGDDDLICGNTAGYIGFVENLNGENPPKWAEPVYLKADDKTIRIQAGYNGSIQGPCEAKWGYTTLSVGDWDHDGLKDIIVNSILGKVIWYKNIGEKTNPKLADAQAIEVEWKGENPKPFWNWWDPEGNNLVTQWRTTPLISDWNKDGLNDLIMLDHEGYLSYFERIKENNRLKLLPGKCIFYNEENHPLQLNHKVAGKSGRKKITIVDWDLDGKPDLLVNSKNCEFYKNISKNNEKIIFKNLGNLTEQKLAGHSTSPTIVDWDKNGIPDLLLGAEDGHFYYLKNPRSNQKFTFSDDGMLKIDGERTFIIGSYHLPKSENPFKTLKENGYNYVRVSQNIAQLDSASKYNLLTWLTTGVIIDSNSSKKISKIVNEFKNHSSLLSWEIADEPAWTWKSAEPRITPKKMLETYKLIKSIDNEHPVYTNHAPVNLVSTLQKYNPSTDIIACDIYPVIPQGIKPTYAIFEDGFQGDLLNTYVSQVGEYVEKMKNVVNNSKPVFIVLQGFAWEMLKPSSERDLSKIQYPTYEESRFMVFNAVVHGVNGIIFWGTNYTPQPSQFMDNLNKVTKELASMQNVLSSEAVKKNIKITYHEMGHSVDAGIEIILKKKDDKFYLITTNSDKNPVKVTFSGFSEFRKAEVLSENREVTLEDGKLTDIYKPFDVHIYQLTN